MAERFSMYNTGRDTAQRWIFRDQTTCETNCNRADMAGLELSPQGFFI